MQSQDSILIKIYVSDLMYRKSIINISRQYLKFIGLQKFQIQQYNFQKETKNKKVDDIMDLILDQINLCSKKKNNFLVLQQNRIGDQNKYLQVNPYESKVFQKFKGQLINGTRILLVDGQQYAHPHTEKLWQRFNQVIIGYWYGKKAAIGNQNHPFQIFKLIPAFFAFSLNKPESKSLRQLHIISTQQHIASLNKISEEEKKKQDFLFQIFDIKKPFQFNMLIQSKNLKVFHYIKQTLFNAFTNPQEYLVFYNDNIIHSVQRNNSLISSPDNQYIIDIHQDQKARNTWKFFFTDQELNEHRFTGHSIGFMNQNQFTNKDKSHMGIYGIKNILYTPGFSVGQLARVLQHRFIYIFQTLSTQIHFKNDIEPKAKPVNQAKPAKQKPK